MKTSVRQKTTIILIAISFLGLLVLGSVTATIRGPATTSIPSPLPIEDFERLDNTPSPLPLSNELLPTATACVRGGCSGQLCVDASFALDGMITTCEWRDEYACYQEAECAVQPSGKCGFTPSPELQQCLNQFNNSIPTL
jgi:hypothetical protein